MKCFAVYEIATGRVVSTGMCTAADLPLQAREGEAVIETLAHLDANRWVFQGGMLVPLPAPEDRPA